MAEDAVHIERIERIRLLMLILKIPDWLVDVVLLYQSHSVVGWTLLSPGTQIHFGNSRGLTRKNVVTEILSINILICPSTHYLSYILVGLLKARGCICCMLSPLSQVILARLLFLT